MQPLYLTKEEFNKLPFYPSVGLQASSRFFTYESEFLIKKITKPLSQKLIRNMSYLIDADYPNYIGPKQLCYVENELVGYVIPKLTNFNTYQHYIYKEPEDAIPIEDRLNIVTDLFEHLRAVHQDGKLIGDIHMDNLLYKTHEFDYNTINQGIVCDLDDYFIPGEDTSCRQLYRIVPQYGYEDMILLPTIAADNIKATISALSLLYHQDFEKYVFNPYPSEEIYYSIYTLLEHLKEVIENEDFYYEIEKILNNCYGLEPITYFDEIAPMVLQDKKLTR